MKLLKTKLALFDCLVVDLPIILYGSEVWGIYSTPEIDKIHLRFCKLILGVKQKTSNGAVICKQRALHYWIKIMNKQDSLMYRMFNKQRIVYNNININRNLKNWYASLLNVLNNLELEYILHDFNNNVYFLPCISKRLCDQYVHQWKDTMSMQPKLYYYRMLKMCYVTNCIWII